MKTQIKIILAITLLAFALTAEATTKNFLNKSTTENSEKENRLYLERDSYRPRSEHGRRRDQCQHDLAIGKANDECADHDYLFRDFEAERALRRQGSGGRLSSQDRNEKRRADRKSQRTEKPCRTERVANTQVYRECRRKPYLQETVPVATAAYSAPVCIVDKPIVQAAECPQDRTNIILKADQRMPDFISYQPENKAIQHEEDHHKDQFEIAHEEAKDRLAQSLLNENKAKGLIHTRKGQLQADAISPKVIIPNECDTEPFEHIRKIITPEGAKAIEKVYKKESFNDSKPGEQSRNKILRTSSSENFSKSSEDCSEKINDIKKPQLNKELIHDDHYVNPKEQHGQEEYEGEYDGEVYPEEYYHGDDGEYHEGQGAPRQEAYHSY